MLKLATNEIKALVPSTGGRYIARLTTNRRLPAGLRGKTILLVKEPVAEVLPEGFLAVFLLDGLETTPGLKLPASNVFALSKDQAYLGDGDVVRFDAQGLRLRALYRRNSKHNSFLVTERCNNYCLMCSQPPKEADDSYIVQELLEAIPLVDRGTNEVGITGGEPTLLGEDLITLIRTIKNYLPDTSLHMLSNGRRFADLEFARKVAAVGHPDFMIGIPIYSDVSNIHDFVVQADGAFDETIRGILNLKRFKQKVEVRVVLHKQTYERLSRLAEFLARNLLFVDHIALMGLEMTGFTKANLEALWIDPADYQEQLVQAVETLARYRMNVSVYNHQLCVLDKRIWKYAVKSISDWKNEYMSECEPCVLRDRCGGFFASARLRYSKHIKAFMEEAGA